MKNYLFGIILLFAFFLVSCAPSAISKCYTEYTYEGDKVKTQYVECINQSQKLMEIDLKNKDLYE